ncbi:MAG: hypothetical protein RBU37_13025 [Myxococcota bacterium]|nr:hypothetical protein [Myxococcota bacterium]
MTGRIATLLLVLLSACPATGQEATSSPEATQGHSAAAPTEHRAYAQEWTGAYLGLALQGGPSWTQEGELGSCLVLSGRLSQVLNLFEVVLDYHFSHHDTKSRPLLKHAVSASLALHPLFLANLGAEDHWYALASLYLQLGASYNLARNDPNSENWSQGPGLVVGSGIDYPLSDVDAGASVWLGVAYRFSLLALERRLLRGGDAQEHSLGLVLSYRHNGLLF